MPYRYSRWDGSQAVDLPDETEAMRRIADEMLAYGDLRSALREMLQRGMQLPNGNRMQGLQELMERLRKRRSQELGRHNLGGMMDDIQKKLDEIISTERSTVDQRIQGNQQQEFSAPGQQSPVSPQDAARRALERMLQKRRESLDQLPPDVGGRIQQLREYDFVDPNARQQFEDLLKQLQQQMMQGYFQGLRQSLQSMTPEAMRQVQEMVRDLNRMLQQKQRGEQPDFQGFMQRWGQNFPQGINSLDDLMKHMQQQIDAMDALMRAMTPEMRRQLEEMMRSLLQDTSLQADLAQLARNLAQMLPQRSLREAFNFSGDDPVTLQEALKLMGELNRMEDLERSLTSAMRSTDTSNLDTDEIARLLGQEAGLVAEQVKELTRMLEKAGLIHKQGANWELTPRAMRKIGERALEDIFGKLRQGMFGSHDLDKRGIGVEHADETRQFQFGDSFSVDVQKSVMNAVMRQGAGTPVRVTPRDFEVRETVSRSQCSTVIVLDVSRSMMMNGCFHAGRKVALALDTLIRTKFPKDNLDVLVFSGSAVALKAQVLLDSQWSDYGGGRGTNIQGGLREARRILSKHRVGTRQVILITDGHPTMYTTDEGYIVRRDPFYPWPDVLAATLKEVARCTKEHITVNTFMLTEAEPALTDFIRMMAKINNGRAFFTTPDRVGQYVLVDYLGKKSRVLE
jgi:uncharacterized protein with von Willebrand factor type A (vWA) domain